MNYRPSAAYIALREDRCSSLRDLCEGREPSCSHSIAGEMDSCLRRNPESPRMAPTGISFGIVSSLQDPCEGRDPWGNRSLPAKWVPACAGTRIAAGQRPGSASASFPLYRIPAKAGTHGATARCRRNGFLPAQEPELPQGSDRDQLRHRRLSDPCEGRNPSGNHPSANGMGHCLRREPALHQILATPDALRKRYSALSGPCPRSGLPPARG